MKHKLIILFIFLSAGISDIYAQPQYPEIMESRQSIVRPVVSRVPSLLPTIIQGKKNPGNQAIDNPGVRYAIQNLKKEHRSNSEIDAAIKTLINYAEDERLRNVVNYLRSYSKGMAEKEKALETIQKKITYDSITFYKENEPLLTSEFDKYMNTDLQSLVAYINSDSNYMWLRKASRDSSLLEILSLADHSVRFWVNTGRDDYYRFWASNRSGDTIGTWIQVLPDGNRLCIHIDEDVYKDQIFEPKKEAIKKDYIENKPPKEYFVLRKPLPGKLHRRYWTYYSEVEIAMSQGILANWAKGGENSLSLLSNIRYYWNYNRGKTSWENWVHYRVGFMKNGDEDIRKNEDRFELNSKLGQKALKHWYYTMQFNTLTQLFNSYDYPKDKEKPKTLVSNLLSPAYFTLSLGMDYKPNDNLSLLLSPITGKLNYVRDTAKVDQTRYGIEKDKRVKTNLGARLDFRNKVSNIFKFMDIRNELTMFYSYNESDRVKENKDTKEEEKITPLTANWKVTVDFKINYFMKASVYTEIIFDESFSKKLQFKENLNLAVNFRF